MVKRDKSGLKNWQIALFVIAVVFIVKTGGFLGATVPVVELGMTEELCSGVWVVEDYNSFCGVEDLNCTVSVLSMSYCLVDGVKILGGSSFRFEHVIDELPMLAEGCVIDGGVWCEGACYCSNGKIAGVEGYCSNHVFSVFVEDAVINLSKNESIDEVIVFLEDNLSEIISESNGVNDTIFEESASVSSVGGSSRISETIIIGIECDVDEEYDDVEKRCIIIEEEVVVEEVVVESGDQKSTWLVLAGIIIAGLIFFNREKLKKVLIR